MLDDKDHIELQDEVLELGAAFASSIFEARKLQISFWDKLVILDAGTLALSINATTAFRGHIVGDGGVGFLFAAWKLLIVSMVLAVLAQWLGSLSTQHFPMAVSSKLIADRRIRLRYKGADIFDGTPEAIKASSLKSFRIDRSLWITAVSLGMASLVLMIYAFVFLGRFGLVNSHTFLVR